MTRRSLPLGRLAIVLVLFLAKTTIVFGQQTRYEFGASFAIGGQHPFIADGDAAFFAKPTIWNLRAQLGTNYIQSISIVLERVYQTADRVGYWSASGNINDASNLYSATISEHLAMTAVYAEANRTILRTDNFRIGIGMDFGYALGGADAIVENSATHATKSYDGDAPWTSFYIGLFARARFTVYESEKLDIGLTATARYWAMPTLGPVATAANDYNGPNVRAIHEIGYLAGISVGIKKVTPEK